MLIGSCELIKKGGFTTVLIASQSKGNLLALGQYRSLGMSLIALCLSQLTHTRMGHRFITNRLHLVHQLTLMNIFYFDQGCLSKAQGKLIPPHLNLNRISHRGNLLQSNLCALGKSHIQEMMPQGAGAIYLFYICTLLQLQLIHIHKANTPFLTIYTHLSFYYK